MKVPYLFQKICFKIFLFQLPPMFCVACNIDISFFLFFSFVWCLFSPSICQSIFSHQLDFKKRLLSNTLTGLLNQISIVHNKNSLSFLVVYLINKFGNSFFFVYFLFSVGISLTFIVLERLYLYYVCSVSA